MANKLAVINPEAKRLPGPELLHDLVARRPRTSNAAIDYTSADGSRDETTYERLHASSDRLAQQLQALRGSRHSGRYIVPLYIQQCTDLYISQLAVLKAGGAFCPIPLDVPEDRLRFILHDVEASILLTTTEMSRRLPHLDGIDIIEIDQNIHIECLDDFTASIQPSYPAYIMYTSGSTGTPKGVIISHAAVTQALLAHDRHIPYFSRFLQFANPTFDVSVFEIFFPLYRGATLVVCDRSQMLSDLPGVISRLNVDAAELTPSVANSLLHDQKSVPGLRLLLTIGEMLKKSVVQEFGGSDAEASKLYGMYGPTEATIHCTLQTSFEKTMSVGNIGVPLDTVSAFVVRPADQSGKGVVPEILEVGEEGELAVGGHQLADGYLNRPEQTDAAFVRHPQYGMIYRTGDRARLTAEGRLEYLGRINRGQVKLRGQRIELGEIEYAAGRTSGCRDVVADVIDNALVVFCVQTEPALSGEAVRQTCRKWLPAFMVPTEVMVLDTLPYLASGKVDRKDLARQYHDNRRLSSAQEHAGTDLSSALCNILSKALGTQIGERTDLAGAGVDSLSAIRVAGELRRSGLPQLNANDILEARSVGDLEILLKGNETKTHIRPGRSTDSHGLRNIVLQASLLQGKDADIEAVYPCISVQSSMLAETARHPTAYCNSVLLEISHKQNLENVAAALNELARQHALLRSGFLALGEGRISHVVIQWKELAPSQITMASQSVPNFDLSCDEAALRPCKFQLRQVEATIHVALDIHHSLYDQWSIDVLRADLSRLLEGHALEPSAPFHHVSEYYASQLETERRADIDYWQECLRDFTVTPVPNLTGLVKAPELHRTSFVRLDFDMEAAIMMTTHAGVSLPSIFQAAYAYLLAALTGSSDVTFGIVFSGRHLPIEGIERTFGPCLTTLPCRVDLSGARTCQDFVRLIHDTNRGMQRHAMTPLAEVKANSGGVPDLPLFDTLFVWQDSSLRSSATSTIRELESVDRHEFNLVLELEPRGNDVALRATYRDNLLPLAQIDLLRRQLVSFADYLIKQPDALLDTLGQSLTPDLLSVWNPEPVECCSPHGITRLVEEQVDRHPHSPAVAFAHQIFDGDANLKTLSYGHFNKRANQVAHYLRSAGIAPDELVCICMEKSPELYIAILGTLKAGAGYLPLTPETPPARIENILRQANVKVCLGDAETVPQLEAMRCLETVVDACPSSFEQFSSSDLVLPYIGHHVAYTVFTSGSTGEPKGVAVTNDNLNGNLMALAKLYDAKPGDRLLQACSQAFDVSVFEIFFAITQGLCLCSGTKSTLFTDFEASIRSLNITHLSLTPTVAALLNPDNVPSVKFLVTAGEAMTDTVREMWAGRGLNQGYGPSETTNICSVNMNMSPHDHLGKVGPPLINTSTYVISPGDGVRVLPLGAVGELAFGGEQVFRGYLGRDDLNHEKLVHDEKLGLMYRSGDIGRIAYDGCLLIAGRLDDQIKIRGNRVELGEVSSVALKDSEVIDCTTVVHGHTANDQQLVLFWVPKTPTQREQTACEVLTNLDQSTHRLFELLDSKLSSYMVPSIVVPLSRLPLTSQGKLDRRYLRQVVNSMDERLRSTYRRKGDEIANEEDWTEEEREIADVLAQLLAIASTSIGRTTSFFALGLNSLTAISLSKHLERKFKRRVRVDAIMKSSSVARLAATMSAEPGAEPQIEEAEKNASSVFPANFTSRVISEYGSRDVKVEKVLPCTPLQEAMLSASATESGNDYYNSTTFRLRGDVEVFQEIWTRLAKRHEILRSRFIQTDSTSHPFAQIVLKDITLPWTSVDSEALAGQDQSSPALDMSQPLHFVLQQTSTNSYLIVHMHHAIYDGVSIDILLREAEHLYKGKQLPPAAEFESFLSAVEAQNSGEAVQYWSRRVQNFVPNPFPHNDVDDAPAQLLTKTTLLVSSDEMSEFCSRHAVTPLSIFHATWAKLLTLSQDASDICFGNVVSGRSISVPGVERLVAPCFNTIPVRIDSARCRSNLQLIRQLQTQNLADLQYQLTSLRRIQRHSKVPHMHLFDSIVLLQPPQSGRDESVWEVLDDHGAMSVPLILEIIPEGGKYNLHLHSQPRFIQRDLADLLASAFDAALSACLAFPSSDVEYLGDFSTDRIKGSLKPAINESLVNGNGINDHHSNDVVEEWLPDEMKVRDVFAELSGVGSKRIAKDTTLYQLGLDSLNAAQIASRLRTNGFDTNVADVLSHVSARNICAAISQKKERSEQVQAVPDFAAFDRQHRPDIAEQLTAEFAQIESVRPCTQPQIGMLAQSVSSQGGLYINHVSYELPADIDVTSLTQAWKAVQQKHQALRTAFVRIEDPVQPYAMVCIVEAPTPVASSRVDAASATLEECEIKATAEIMQDLAHTPWRVRVQQRSTITTMTLSIHHALYDAEGLQYILNDLAVALSGEALGRSLSIDPLLLQCLNKLQGQEAQKFWETRLQDASIVRFPDLQPETLESKIMISHARTLRISQSALHSWAKEHNATVQAIAQSIWAVLLAAYTGESNVTFGTVLSARLASKSHATAFPSVLTIPVLCDTSKAPADVVHDMVSYNASVYRYRHTPLADLQRFAGDANRALFDTVFVYQKPMQDNSGSFDWPVIRETAAVDYAVSLELEAASDDKMLIRLTASSQSMPAEQVKLMLEQYDYLLALATEDDVSIPPRLTSVLPAKEGRLPSEVTYLHDFVERGALQHPNAPALEFVYQLHDSEVERKTWTYQQLDRRANQVAHLLRQHNVRPGGIVALCMTKCPEATFAFVGILKAGCSFLALDPDLPKARREFILEDSSAAALLVDAQIGKDAAEGPASKTPSFVITEELLSRMPDNAVLSGLIDANATSYCLYTSGTTGNPKGCEITHENAVQAMLAFQRLFAGHWTASSRWLQFASYWFDVSVLEQFWSWSVGITVVGAPRDLVLNDLSGFIQQLHITHIDLTPSLARLVHPDDVPSLHGGVFITGGEALKQEIIDAWGAVRTVCNGYGPTEATIGVTMNTFVGPNAKPSNIGRQFDNVGSLVLAPDSDMAVPRGAVGELCVSGPLVGKGYLSRPELTARSFPYLRRHGQRVYRTGDLVRLLADGSFCFIGRKDTQAKLRGQRLEIGEIDSTIKAASEEIAEVVSLVVKTNDGSKQTLVSFLTAGWQDRNKELTVDSTVEAQQLVDATMGACKHKLPGYMVPTHIIPINRIPLTVNNKIDSKKLSALFTSLSSTKHQSGNNGADDGAPLNDVERKICSVLSKLLQVDVATLTRSTNIFSTGLSSVSAITFASLLKRSGLHQASVAIIMRCSSVGDLATALSPDNANNGSTQGLTRQAELSITAFVHRHRRPTIDQLPKGAAVATIAPCSPLQAGMILESMRSEQRPYFNEFRYRLHKIDWERLQKAFMRLTRNIDTLRTLFIQTDDGLAQVVLESPRASWHECEPALSGVERTLKQYRAQWIAVNDADVVQPIQVVAVRSEGQHVLVFHIHHALYDGISWGLLLDRLAEAYQEDSTPDCGPSFVQTLAYGPLRTEPGAKAFWQKLFSGTIPRRITRRRELLSNDPVVADVHVLNTEGLEETRTALGVSHQAVLQACFEVALQQHFADTNVYGQVVSGRNIAFEGADRVIGPLFNTLPATLRLEKEDTWSDHITRSHRRNVSVLPYQHTPLSDIRKWLGCIPSDRLFEVLFVFQNQHESAASRSGELFQPLEQSPTADHPLAFEVSLDIDGGLHITAVAQSNITDGEGLEALLRSFERAVRAACGNSDRHVAKDFEITSVSNGYNHDREDRQAAQVNGIHNFEWTQNATALRQAIAQVAGVANSDVDEHTSMFALGLDSIDAVRLASRVRKAGLALPVSKILTAQTIPRMLADLQNKQSTSEQTTEGVRKVDDLERILTQLVKHEINHSGSVERFLPTTPHQEALIADMLRSEYREYYNHDILQIQPDVDLQKLQAAWQTVVDRSPILRTGFMQVTAPAVDVTFAQVIWKPGRVVVSEVENTSQDEMDSLLKRITDDVVASRDGECPTRITFVTWNSERYLVLSLAHAQYDGHSLALIHEDVDRAYHATLDERPSYNGLIEEALGATNEEARKFWNNGLSGARLIIFPSRQHDDFTDTVHRAERVSQLSSESLRSFCQKHGVSIQALAQTCWSMLLAHYTHSFEVQFGVVLACRDSEEAEQVMFPTMNTVPVRTMLHGTRRELLQYMQSMINDMRPYQRTPLRIIQAGCANVVDRRDVNGSSGLFDTLFIYQHRPKPEAADDKKLYESVGGSSSVEYPVAVEMEIVDSEVHLRTACKDSVLDKQGTRVLLRELDQVLRRIVEAPEEPSVDFVEAGILICGLPAFTMVSEKKDKVFDEEPVLDCKEDDQQPSPVALTIREVLAKVAKVSAEDIALNTTIESIGIDSISAIKVAALLREQEISISVSDILRAKTISKMAETASSKTNASKPQPPSDEIVAAALRDRGLDKLPREIGIAEEHVEAILPATAGQVYMLSVWQASGGQLFYPTFSYELKGEVDLGKIQHSWERLVARHEILRTVFCTSTNAEMPMLQVVLKDARESFAEGNQEMVYMHSGQPLVAISASRIEMGFKLDLKIHHALYDAVSLPLLIQDFEALLLNSEPKLPTIKQQDFLALNLTAGATQARKDFWTSYLGSAAPLALTQPKAKGQKKRVEVFKPGLVIQASTLEELARKESVAIQALLFATYAKTYASIAATQSAEQEAKDVVLGIYLSNRSHLPDLDKLAAPTLNFVPLLVRSPYEKSVIELAREVQKDLQEMGTPERSSMALWEIAEWTDVKIDTFVNFIKLPEADSSDLKGDKHVVIEEMDGYKRMEYARVSEPVKEEAFKMPGELQGMKVSDAYQYALDLEATVVGGALDVGLFCPEEMLGLQRAEGVLEDMKGMLEKIGGKAEE